MEPFYQLLTDAVLVSSRLSLIHTLITVALRVCVRLTGTEREKHIKLTLLSRLSSSANKEYLPVPDAITHVCPFISAQTVGGEQEQ